MYKLSKTTFIKNIKIIHFCITYCILYEQYVFLVYESKSINHAIHK